MIKLDPKQDKLEFFQDLYDNAETALQEEIARFEKNKKQYNGSLEIEGGDDASTGRNITYELIESQFSSYLPCTAVTPERYSEKNERNAKSIETLLKNKHNKLPFEKHNDMDERFSPVYGGSVWLVEWDNSIKTHNTVGDVKVTIWSPPHFIGQPKIYDIDDMEYCFITFETTKEDLMRKYNVSKYVAEATESDEANENDETATVIVCYYKNQDNKICQYIWSGDIELQDIEDYYSRKIYVCKSCGKRKELCNCENPDYELQSNEYELLDHDIRLSDGGVIPASSEVIKDGQVVMETVKTQALLPDGSVALENVDGFMVPAMTEMQVPKLEQTKLPYFTPTKFPIVIRKNTSKEDCLFGQSDCEKIKDQQINVNKLESRKMKKLMSAGVYPTCPEDEASQFDNGLFDDVIKVNQNNYKLFGRIDLQVSIQQEAEEEVRQYDSAKRILGITDSYQGQYDASAQSGKAKQIQVNQAAGRLDSKRRMKNFAYADIDEIIFQYFLAYADEPRVIAFRNAQGILENVTFNRYDFIERDENGEYYYDYDYLFSTDVTGDVETSRETMWSEAKAMFQAGCYGDPKDINTLLFFWQQMEKYHYPKARDMVDSLKAKIQAQQQALQEQLAAAQADNENLKIQKAMAENKAATANGYIDYLNSLKQGGNA